MGGRPSSRALIDASAPSSTAVRLTVGHSHLVEQGPSLSSAGDGYVARTLIVRVTSDSPVARDGRWCVFNNPEGIGMPFSRVDFSR